MGGGGEGGGGREVRGNEARNVRMKVRIGLLVSFSDQSILIPIPDVRMAIGADLFLRAKEAELEGGSLLGVVLHHRQDRENVRQEEAGLRGLKKGNTFRGSSN